MESEFGFNVVFLNVRQTHFDLYSFVSAAQRTKPEIEVHWHLRGVHHRQVMGAATTLNVKL